MDPAAQRAAQNEALFREANERIEEAAQGFRAHALEALCECSNPECAETVRLKMEEYAAVRSHGDRFAMVSGHEDPQVERVVDRTDRFVVVEKIGEGGDVARDLDPRG